MPRSAHREHDLQRLLFEVRGARVRLEELLRRIRQRRAASSSDTLRQMCEAATRRAERSREGESSLEEPAIRPTDCRWATKPD